MQPTNEQVVAACQRAGIKEVQHGHETLIWNSETPAYVSVIDDGSLYSETTPGSALFIVAVLGALPKPIEIRKWRDGRCHFTWSGEHEDGIVIDTLTAACMAAIVAAFPPEE